MTPLEKFGEVYLKREDMNLTGSAKDRAIKLQVENLLKLGFTQAVISSSGNAAISAQYFCNLKNIKLTIFVAPQTDPSKLKLLKNFILSPQPNSDAFKFAKDNHAYNLRQSTDPVARLCYQLIATEILEQYPQVSSIFIPVGSGATLLGISEKLPPVVKIFAVQPASHCPIAGNFDHNFIPETDTATDALSVKMLPLKQSVISTCYSGVVVQNADVLAQNLTTSAEGNLAYAGYLKAKNNFPIGDFPIILLTGAKRS